MNWYEWRWYALKERLQRSKCWFVGHETVYGDYRVTRDPDFCWNCGLEWPQDDVVLPMYLRRIYVWFVEREWRWFDALDYWLCFKSGWRLPSWWEY